MNAMVTLLLFLCTVLLSVEGACKSKALSEFEIAILDKHNELRGKHKDTADLCYGETGSDVTFTAQTWAGAMANAKVMKHSTGGSYGENLAYAGTTGTVPERKEAYMSSTQAWYDEIKDWNFGSSKSKGGVTGHFTQVVWRETKQVNCGYATFTKDSFNSYYVVCQYYPPGNYAGKYALQVAPLSAAFSKFNTAVFTLVSATITLCFLV